MEGVKSFTQKDNGQTSAEHRQYIHIHARSSRTDHFHSTIEEQIGEDRRENAHVTYRQDAIPLRVYQPTGLDLDSIEGSNDDDADDECHGEEAQRMDRWPAPQHDGINRPQEYRKSDDQIARVEAKVGERANVAASDNRQNTK